MKIGIDADMFINPNGTGIPNSVFKVLDYWKNNHPEHEYYLFAYKKITLFDEYPSNWHVVDKWPIKIGRFWRMFGESFAIRKYGVDVFWGTNYFLPNRVKSVRYVLTIYDMALYLIEGIGEKKNLNRMKRNLPRSVNNSDKIIAISQSTKDDIKKIFNVDDKKVIVSYCGIDNEGNCSIDFNNVRSELKFEAPFFLFVSTIEPRKNIITIIRAFEEYLNKYDGDELLVLAGQKGWNCDNIYSAIDNSKYKDRIILPGYISSDEKKYLLTNAKAFLYPSLYEGFGLPVLEAFKYNLPVITSNVSSLPEVAGDAAFYIEKTTDYHSLCMKMREVMELTENEKADLANRMTKQRNKFSWDKNAEEIMEVLSI
ncbi:Glycosyltransferase involved in cell wall bisynthesis [Butyrivibrio proteoclasticus]|uniref:Glycosyltransferase involved in cell wall bisynthesis n=1 Tax=Butyrivibrio proteoclasticus TaxID=43305 RepID=A0A1I5PTB9_9FIRM|nr:glycosyltransferase family 1 protein [Butyrivibrio proteoclasticus]SFP37214.1 Glycosyltransferase involved in cell wall bisynthesis [Butyrivibrio proteoclasticus]